MASISAIVLTKNNEDIIEKCLKSLSFCNETILIDENSSDATVAKAHALGAKVIEETGNDFAKRRNLGLKLAKGEWILYLDTDEVINPELAEEIKKTVNDVSQSYNAYKLKRKNFYYGNHLWPNTEKLERLFKKNKLEGWFGKLHETAKVKGEVGILKNFLMHYSHQDLSQMVMKTNMWSETEANLRFSSHHPKMVFWRFFRVMYTAFFDSYIKQSGWKAGTAGIVESIYQSFSIFITYAKLWELQTKDQRKILVKSIDPKRFQRPE